MRGDHDFGVLPFGGPVVAGDQAYTVKPAEVAEHEGIAGLGLVGRAVGEREVPGRVLLPAVGLKEGVFVSRAWLYVGPPAA